MIRVRIAPSPTGKLHLGTARTALFNYLFAKKNQGVFILRIEDTDQTRSTKEFEKDIIDGLKWLGLNWDEGPYRQMERLAIYEKYAEKLIKDKKAYYCYCTPAELEKERKEQAKKKLPSKYSGKCRNLAREQINKYEKEGRKKAIRFRVEPQIIEFDDLIHGKLKFDTSLDGDLVIIKSDGIPTFHFGVVVDDYEMKITHIIRGEDHISNTPKQILLQKALRFSQPQYAHLPLILNPDKSKMSKRYGAVDITEYKKMGYLKEAIINYLALLGWTPGGQEINGIDELIKKFSISDLQKSPAIFYQEKLDWVNGEWLRRLKVTELSQRIKEFGFKCIDERIITIIQERMKRLDEIPFWTNFFFQEIPYKKELLTKGQRGDSVKKILEIMIADLTKIVWKSDTIKAQSKQIAEKMDIKLKDFLYPIRIAITGSQISPPLFESMEILGKKESIKRLKKATSKL